MKASERVTSTSSCLKRRRWGRQGSGGGKQGSADWRRSTSSTGTTPPPRVATATVAVTAFSSGARPVTGARRWRQRKAPHADRLSSTLSSSTNPPLAPAPTTGGVPPTSTPLAPTQPHVQDAGGPHRRPVRSARGTKEEADRIRPAGHNIAPEDPFGEGGGAHSESGAPMKRGAPHPMARAATKRGGAANRGQPGPTGGHPTRAPHSSPPRAAPRQPAGASSRPPPGFRKTACTQQRRIVSPSLRLTCSTRAVRSSSTSNPTDVKRAASSSCVKK